MVPRFIELNTHQTSCQPSWLGTCLNRINREPGDEPPGLSYSTLVAPRTEFISHKPPGNKLQETKPDYSCQQFVLQGLTCLWWQLSARCKGFYINAEYVSLDHTHIHKLKCETIDVEAV